MNFLSIHDPATDRQANNLREDALSATVATWFEDMSGDHRVRQALKDLDSPRKRAKALKFLGLEMLPAA